MESPLPASTQSRSVLGVDARAAVEVPAGRGRVVRELLRALAARQDDRRYLLYARRRWDDVELDQRFHWCLLDTRDPWWHLRAAIAANGQCGAFLSSNSYLTAAFLRIPVAPIVHDMIPFEPAMRPNRRSAVTERLTLPVAVRRSAALICTSKATCDALHARFPATMGRTRIAPLGATLPAAELTAAEASTLPAAGFVLAVGTLEPRKNLPRLVAAYCQLSEELQNNHPLVVVGALGWEAGQTLAALRSLGERCTMLGHVSDAALAEIYRRCALFCYPSLGEGFGLPVLEAMAAGAAVVTSNLSSLPEVGGDAVQYVDPHQVASIAAGMRQLLCDEGHRSELGRRGATRAHEFTWGRFAEQVVGVLAEIST